MTLIRPVPIFVLGLQRSGTTLAANLLAAQPGVAAVSAARHQGIHESVFFSHFLPEMTPWPRRQDRGKAVRIFLDSEYFHLTGLDQHWAQEMAEDCRSPVEFFCRIMETFAAEQKAHVWVEKSPHHTLLANQIAQAIPDALFLCVSRDTTSFLRSRLWSYGRNPPPYPQRAAAIARACASNQFHCRWMQGLADRIGRHRVFHVGFKTLTVSPAEALAPVLAQAGVSLQGLEPSGYAANSSFSDPGQRKKALTQLDLLIARIADAFANAVPQAMLQYLQRRFATRRTVAFPHWVWAQRSGLSGPPAGQGGAKWKGET